jgi:hypothetical protein
MSARAPLFCICQAAYRAIRMLAVLAAFAAFGAPAEAGFFEDLFGGAQTPGAAPMDGRGRASREHVRRVKIASLAEAAGPQRARFCVKDDNPSKTVDSTQALMRDPTLRHGDVVVTDEGVRVFEGGGACPHAISDFRTLAETRDLNVGTRKLLAAIERDMKTKNIARAGRPIVATDPPSGHGR